MPVADLKGFAEGRGIVISPQSEIVEEALSRIISGYGSDPAVLKANFDDAVSLSESLAYDIYLEKEAEYGRRVFSAFARYLSSAGEIRTVEDFGTVLGDHFSSLDRFYLSLAQSRKSRAGRGFEDIHNRLFSMLGYPFTSQAVINGKPDFIMPSVEYYRKNPMDSIIFTAKRTIRERWRQIVTEGTRGLGFYLATIDADVSGEQLAEMMSHRIYLVVPAGVRGEMYSGRENVISFAEFFRDHLDPRMAVWRRKGVI